MAVLVNAAVAGVGTAQEAEGTPISANGTTVIKAAPGVFYGFVGLSQGSSWVIQALDSATGSLTGTEQELYGGPAPAPQTPGSVGSGGQASPPFGVGVRFYKGLTIVASGPTPGSMLVCWK